MHLVQSRPSWKTWKDGIKGQAEAGQENFQYKDESWKIQIIGRIYLEGGEFAIFGHGIEDHREMP